MAWRAGFSPARLLCLLVPYNAAFWLADLEIAFPVAVADRRSVPLFPGDDAGSPLAFSMADTIFHAAAVEVDRYE